MPVNQIQPESNVGKKLMAGSVNNTFFKNRCKGSDYNIGFYFHMKINNHFPQFLLMRPYGAHSCCPQLMMPFFDALYP